MRTLPIALLLFVLQAQAQVELNLLGRRPTASVTYAFTETFDAAGYDKTGWSESGTTTDEDYTTSPAPLSGTQSLRLVAANVNQAVGPSTNCIYFQMNITTLSSGFYVQKIFSGAFASLLTLEVNVNKLRVYNGSVLSSDGATTLSTGTTYHVWVEYTKGTGANGVSNVYLSTTSTKPGSVECAVTNGDATGDPGYFYFQHNSEGIFDRVIFHTSAIGSAP